MGSWLMVEGVRTDPESLRERLISLWPDKAPAALGDGLEDQPMLSIHIPTNCNGCAIIVAPGGGYRTLASDHEGLQVARWLNRRGVAAFVLRYRLGPRYHSSVSRLDGQRAIRWTRANATQMGISPDRIGVLGFSAGGHLSCALATAWDSGQPGDAVDALSCRPDFIVPVYAVTNGKKRGRKADEYTPVDEQVKADSPPAFIVTTHEDSIVAANQSTLYYDACLAAGIKAELHIFNDGEHGLGLAPGDPDLHAWTDLLHAWLRRRGYLTSQTRTPVSGTLSIDGAIPGIAWVTLIPKDPDLPLNYARINRASGGRFTIDKDGGVVPGEYRLEIHIVSEQYPHVGTGLFSLPDKLSLASEISVRPGQPLHLEHSRRDFA